ncbi:MAG: TonB family protein, partial [Planctomycetes bacterium]|nr:TonB family protein [Planctomycetota bacterium]
EVVVLRRNVRLRPPRPPIAVEPEPKPEPKSEPKSEPATVEAVASARVLTPVSGHNPTPVYPRAARRHHIEGIVMIRVDVDDDGVAIRCAVLTTSGCTLLDDAALRAARQWRFDGGPGVIDLPFRFELVRRS